MVQLIQRDLSKRKHENVLSQLWFKYFPYWPLILLLVFGCIITAWLYVRYKIPIYESNATILIKDENKGLDDSKMLEFLNQWSTKKIIENEVEVLKSRSLMNEVVKSLGLYVSMFEEGKIIKHSAYKISPIKIVSNNPDSIINANHIYFHLTDDNKVVIKRVPYPMNVWVQTKFGILKFIPNELYKGEKTPLPLFFNITRPKEIANSLISSLSVMSVNKLSTLINLKFEDEIPERGEDVLNELIVAYNKAAIEDKNTLAANTLTFVEDRLKIVASELDSIESTLEHYKAVRGATDISAQGRMFLENVSSNDQKLSAINIQLSVLDQVESYVLSKNGNGELVPSILGINDPVLLQLLDRLFTTQLEYEKLKITTAENNPILVTLAEQINKIKPSIVENLRSQKKSLEASKRNLYTTNGEYASILRSLPKKERDLLEISREQTIKSNIYTFLLQKREETALSHSSAVADSRIVDKAQTFPNPISPNRKKIYMISIVFGLGLGIGLISIKDFLSSKILYRQEIEDYTVLPIVGELINMKTKSPIIFKTERRGLIVEQFRRIRASLQFLGLNQQKKKLLVTSSISKEGKSFIVANLGLSLAMAGKKVVIVELDLVNPTLCKKLNINSKLGVSSYLIHDINIDDLIIKTNLHENLFIISSGPLPENPSELLLNGKIEFLLEILDQKFDFIIIDTAPVYALSDAYVLSPLCDATLYIIRHAITPKILVQRMDENNKINELKNVAVIFNGVRSRGFLRENYGYGYTYKEKI